MVTVPSLVDETPLDQYTATASQTDFNFTYMIFATADIKVYVNGVLKTETTDYVVKQSDGSAIVPADDLPMDGGKVVFNSGLTLNDEVSLSRDIAIERLTGYSVAGAFRADVVNAEFTKLYAVQQQLERDISRTLRLSASDAEGGSLELPTNRASKFLAFDANGDMIASAGSADSITVSTFMATVLDDTTAAAALTTLGISSYAQTLLDDANAAAARATMGLSIGSDIQAYNANLANLASLSIARGDLLVGNSTPELSKLAKGSANYLLKSDGTDVNWGFEVLDEDNMSSDSNTKLATQQSIKAYVDSNASKIIQVAYNQTTAYSSGTGTIPWDNTKPQSTEGNEFLTQSITPTNSSNDLFIEAFLTLTSNTSGRMTVALFKDTDTDAIASTFAWYGSANEPLSIPLRYKMSAGTTSAITFKIRAGMTSSSTFINGSNTSQIHNGVATSSLSITEIKT